MHKSLSNFWFFGQTSGVFLLAVICALIQNLKRGNHSARLATKHQHKKPKIKEKNPSTKPHKQRNSKHVFITSLTKFHSLHERETSWFGKCRNSTWKKGQDGKEHFCSASKNKWSKEERIATSKCGSVAATISLYLQDLALLDCLEIWTLSRGYIIPHASKQNNCSAQPGGLQIWKALLSDTTKPWCYLQFQNEG